MDGPLVACGHNGIAVRPYFGGSLGHLGSCGHRSVRHGEKVASTSVAAKSRPAPPAANPAELFSTREAGPTLVQVCEKPRLHRTIKGHTVPQGTSEKTSKVPQAKGYHTSRTEADDGTIAPFDPAVTQNA